MHKSDHAVWIGEQNGESIKLSQAKHGNRYSALAWGISLYVDMNYGHFAYIRQFA